MIQPGGAIVINAAAQKVAKVKIVLLDKDALGSGLDTYCQATHG